VVDSNRDFYFVFRLGDSAFQAFSGFTVLLSSAAFSGGFNGVRGAVVALGHEKTAYNRRACHIYGAVGGGAGIFFVREVFRKGQLFKL
jgi:hypothetical protein